MNCQNCKHKGSVVTGSSHHISCRLVGDLAAQIEVAMYYKLGWKFEVPDKTTREQKPLIVLNPHGVRNGWCDWPLQFDPIWVENCVGYTELETSKTSSNEQ